MAKLRSHTLKSDPVRIAVVEFDQIGRRHFGVVACVVEPSEAAAALASAREVAAFSVVRLEAI